MGDTRESAQSGAPRFDIVRQIGAGGMGIVYEAYDSVRDARVALKTLRRMDADALYRFKKEFNALADIEHPNLVHLGELIFEDDSWFFTMEYVDGVDFLSYVRAHPTGGFVSTPSSRRGAGPAPPHALRSSERSAFEAGPTEPGATPPPAAGPADSRSYDEGKLRQALAQLARALEALHAAGRVHRDIKPSNVLVTRQGRVVLLDFGLVSSTTPNTATQPVAAGTAAYMAPEQAAQATVQPAADWYSFGVVLYEALTGRLPYQGKTDFDVLLKKQQYEPPPPRARNPGVPRDLDALCVDLLRIEAKSRPAGRDVLERLGIDDGDQPSPLVSRTSSLFTQHSPFVGRETELAVLSQGFDDATAGEAVTIFVHGESGVGKSELVRHFTDTLHAERGDVVVLAGRCYERASVPYKAFDGIADALSRFLMQLPGETAAALLPRRASLLSQLFPVLQRVEAIAAARKATLRGLDPQEIRRRLFAAFQELLARLGQRYPLILVIDDFQWSDADSRQLLSELIHPPDAPPALVLATVRTMSDDARTVSADDLQTIGDVRHVWLESLSMERARQLVELLIPRAAQDDPDLVDSIAREAGGHPMFIQELVRHASDEGSAAGLRLDDALWTRVERLPPADRRLLELLCVAGTPIRQEVAVHADKRPYEAYEKSVSLLRVACLARTSGPRERDTIEPYHDRVREAVLAHLDRERQRTLHRSLAIALEQAGAGRSDPQSLVRHFAESGDTRSAAQHAEIAAAQAAEALAFDHAATLYRTSLKLGTHDDDERRKLYMELGEALSNAGRGPEAAEVLLRAADGAEPAARLSCQQRGAEQLLISGHLEEGLETMATLLGELGVSMPRTPRRSLVSLLWNRLLLRLRGLRWKRKHESEVPARTLVQLDVYQSLAHSLGVVDSIRGADFQARALRLALQTGEPVRLARALFMESIFHATEGSPSLRRARSLYRRAEDLDAQDDRYLRAWSRGTDGILSLYEGRFEAATASLEKGEELMRSLSGAAFEAKSIRMFHVLALRFMGAIPELTAQRQESLREAVPRGDRHTDTTIRYLTTLVWLARDEPHEAHRDLERATWVPPAGAFHLQHWYELEGRGELALYRGEAARFLDERGGQFGELSRSLLSRMQRVRVTASWLRARLLLARSRDRDRNEVAKIARSLEGEGIGYAEAYAELLRAGLSLARAEPDAALKLLAAAKTAESNDMRLCMRIARFRHEQLTEEVPRQTREALVEMDVVNPERLADVYVPRPTGPERPELTSGGDHGTQSSR